MTRLSKRSIDKIILFLNDKEFNYITLSRRELTILFKIYQSATSEILELEEEIRSLKQEIDDLEKSTDLYEYLQEHNYISKKNPLVQQELSEERAQCIANKCESLMNEEKENFLEKVRSGKCD